MPHNSKAIVKSVHIVVVDDDPAIRDELQDYLTSQNYRVSTADGGTAMRQILERESPDLIIMDLMMPEEDGLTLVKSLCKTSTAAIIILTGKDDPIDRVVGLELGADDYILKPFYLRELLARVRSVLRRAEGVTDASFGGDKSWLEFAGWKLSLPMRQLISPNNAEVPLTTAEFDLLVVFIKNKRRVLSRDGLLDLTQNRQWSPFDRAIDNLVGRLRKKIEVNPKNPSLIKTVRGVGYVFTHDVTIKTRS